MAKIKKTLSVISKRTKKAKIDENLLKYQGTYKCKHDKCIRTIRLDKDTLMMKRDGGPEFKIEVSYLERLIMFNSFKKI